MKNNNKDLLMSFYEKRSNNLNENLAYHFIKKNYPRGLDVYDEVIDKYKQNTDFIEQQILDIIQEALNLDTLKNNNYISLYTQKLNVSVIKNDSNLIIFDEVLEIALMSMYLTIISLAFNPTDKNKEKCIESINDIINNQMLLHTIEDLDISKVTHKFDMSESCITLAMDIYWISWTFIVLHEIYHILNDNKINSKNEELAADRFAYTMLIKLISINKNNNNLLSFFNESMYLVPVILFKSLGFLFNKTNIRIDYSYPSFDEREEQINDLFDPIVPDDFDTYYGNELLNHFWDQFDILYSSI